MKTTDLSLNRVITSLEGYTTKEVSKAAAAETGVVDLSFGQPAFGPPPAVLASIADTELSIDAFLASAKRYEDARGSRNLREAVADWYRRRYDMIVDPETEIMITHGGMEALVLAFMLTTETSDTIAVSDPAYMAYARTARALGRNSFGMPRPAGGNEIAEMLVSPLPRNVRAIIINSPENPTGYVASHEDWTAIADFAEQHQLWIIHDEVYDVMATGERPHVPAACFGRLRPRTILVNSFSKKFGLPGLRIGWLIAPAEVVRLAAKLHDYLYLGVNIQSEGIATRLLSDVQSDEWLANVGRTMASRAATAATMLSSNCGYRLPRRPHGAMFIFPDVQNLYANLPGRYRDEARTAGEAVARYLLHERKVAVTRGAVYGELGKDNVRIVLCTSQHDFELGLSRMEGL